MVERVHNLLEAIGNHFVERTWLDGMIHHFVGALIVIFAIVESDEVVHIHQKLGSGAGAGKL